MFKTGKQIADYIEPTDKKEELSEEQIQPNGVDLTVDTIFKFDGKSYITDDEYIKARRDDVTTINPTEVSVGNDDTLSMDESYNLTRGAYVVRYAERITIPEAHVGFVLPRSRLIRNGIHLNTAVWDQGYSGIGEGGLFVVNPTMLESNMRIAQIVMCRAGVTDNLYDGQHQGENLDEE